MADETKAAKAESQDDTKWSAEELIRDARGIGATPAEVAGALHLVQKGNKKYFTRGEVDKALAEFRKREV